MRILLATKQQSIAQNLTVDIQNAIHFFHFAPTNQKIHLLLKKSISFLELVIKETTSPIPNREKLEEKYY